MFQVNEDKSIYLTRGDAFALNVGMEKDGTLQKFKAGDVVRFKVTEKKKCESVVLVKDVEVESESEKVNLSFSSDETKFGDVINKPKDYWYEVERNPGIQSQTIIGYDEDGPKILKLFPEGGDA